MKKKRKLVPALEISISETLPCHIMETEIDVFVYITNSLVQLKRIFATLSIKLKWSALMHKKSMNHFTDV